MSQDYELGRAVGAMAIQAAFNDPRFMPLQAAELNNIEIELSILTPMKAIKTPEEIVIGRDGVLMRKGSSSAVFLPQVAVENNWKRNEMLDNLCIKAGLSKGCWKRDAKFQVFQAEVFSESEILKKKPEYKSDEFARSVHECISAEYECKDPKTHVLPMAINRLRFRLPASGF